MTRLKDTIYLNIAGFNIQINFKKTEWNYLRQRIEKLYQGFISNNNLQKISYKIEFVDGNTALIFKTSKSIFFYKEKKTTIFHQISIAQFQYILRDILQTLLIKQGGFFLHASANNFDGKVVLFLGKNGAGKSTVTQFLNEKYPSLADDSAILKKENKVFSFYQTPFMEKKLLISKKSKSYKLEKIFFLRKAGFFRIERINNNNYILQEMINQFYTDQINANTQIKYLFDFVTNFNQFYILYFAKNKEKVINLFNLDFRCTFFCGEIKEGLFYNFDS